MTLRQRPARNADGANHERPGDPRGMLPPLRAAFDGGRRVLRRDGPAALAHSTLDFLNARWQLRSADRVGTVRLRGRASVTNKGEMRFGDQLRLWGTAVPLLFSTRPGGLLEIEDGTFVNYGADISAVDHVRVGRRCNIGQYAIIIDSDYHDLLDHGAPGRSCPVIIEDDVWIAARVTVLRGSRIGRGAVIGAHSVVSGEIPAFCLAAGAPARVIRELLPRSSPPTQTIS
jgi:acetyltransferase-like isoleucine patch superfamily enzyme